jgi:hypothetical protein
MNEYQDTQSNEAIATKTEDTTDDQPYGLNAARSYRKLLVTQGTMITEVRKSQDSGAVSHLRESQASTNLLNPTIYGASETRTLNLITAQPSSMQDQTNIEEKQEPKAAFEVHRT